MNRRSIEKLQFKNIQLKNGSMTLLNRCNFDFPLDTNCRLVFKNDMEKFFFFNGFSQLAGFSGGEYLFNGENVLDFSFEEFLSYRLNIGFGFATRGILHNKTLRENLLLPVYYHKTISPYEARKRVDYLLDFFEMGEERNRRPAEVSTSHMKSTLILRAFVHNPEWIVLDAPDILLSNQLYANLLQLVDEQRKEHGLRHFYFATQDEDLAQCMSASSILVGSGTLSFIKHEGKKLRGVS